MDDIIDKIKQTNLVGRGGACFPVAQKWEMVKNAFAEKKYVICNAAEGEPGVEKDGYILENYNGQVIDGINLAINFLSSGVNQEKVEVKAILYINNNYYKRFAKKLLMVISGSNIELFIKPLTSGYIGGEESAIINAIEHKRVEPRLRPPFPTTDGLWGCPTLINNVETFYNVSLVAKNKFKDTRFYTLSGDCPNGGVYQLPANYTITRVLKETDNFPKFSFFIQAGGSAAGEVLNSQQLRRSVSGAGSITIHSLEKNGVKKIMKTWLEFFKQESCGLCTPCREGVYRLNEIINLPKPDWQLFSELLENLTSASFCGLGCIVPVALESFIKNVLPQISDRKIDLPRGSKETICQCFSN